MFPKIVGSPPKSSNLIRFSIINHPFWGTPIFGNPHFGDADFFLKLRFWQADDAGKKESIRLKRQEISGCVFFGQHASYALWRLQSWEKCILVP